MPTTSPSRGRALLALLRPDARRWAVLGALLAVSSALALAGPLVVRTIVDRASDGAPTSTFVALALAFLAIAVVTQVIGVVVIRYATVTAWGTTNELRLRMTRHVLGLDHEFHRTHTPGELIQRVDGDVTSVSDFLSQVVPQAVGGVHADLRDARRAHRARLAPRPRDARVPRHRRGRAAGDAAPGDHRGVRRDGRARPAVRRHRGAADGVRGPAGERRRRARHVALRRGQRRHAAQLGAPPAGVHPPVVGGAELGDASARCCRSSSAPRSSPTGRSRSAPGSCCSSTCSSSPARSRTSCTSWRRCRRRTGRWSACSTCSRCEATIVDAGTTSPPPGALGVSCRGVSFGYGDVDDDGAEQMILRDLDLDVAPGRSVGVVGRTGSGKTTFSRLLLRLVEPTAGTVSLGGVPMADIPLAELRRRVALVPQEVELFEGTIRDNVTLFDAEPTDDAVDRRARRGPASATLARVGDPPRPRRRRRRACRPASRSCWRWPGCGCASPTSSCSTRPRRASTRSPSSASRPPSPS